MDLLAHGRLASIVSRAGGFEIGGGFGDEAWLARLRGSGCKSPGRLGNSGIRRRNQSLLDRNRKRLCSTIAQASTVDLAK